MTGAVSAAEFTRSFDHCRALARREAVPVSENGEVAGYFVGQEKEASLSVRG